MNLANRILYRFFKALARLAQALPRPVALACGAGFGRFIYGLYRLTPYRDFIANNLRVSYGRDLPEPELHAIAKKSITNLTKCIAEVLRLPILDRELDSIVSIKGLHWFEEAYQAGNGVVMLTAHFGNWELLAATMAKKGYPLSVLVQTPSKAAFDQLFIEFRKCSGIRTFANHGVASLRPVMKALRNNEVLGLLCDQHGEGLESFATLFGHPVSVPAGPYQFSEKTGAALLPVFTFRDDKDHHCIRFYPPIQAQSPQELGEKLYACYEEAIKDAPDHWLWAHNRWEREPEVLRAQNASL